MTSDGGWDEEAQLQLANSYLEMSDEAAYIEPAEVFATAERNLETVEDDRPRVYVIISHDHGYWFSHTGVTPNTALGDLNRFLHRLMHTDDE